MSARTTVRVYVTDAQLNAAVIDGETLPYQMVCYCRARFGDAYESNGEITYSKTEHSWTTLVELK